MNKVINEFAALFKERDNPNKGFDVFEVGTVTQSNPNIQIQLDENIFLDKDDLIFISNEQFHVGNEVVIIPSEKVESYLVLGKVVRY